MEHAETKNEKVIKVERVFSASPDWIWKALTDVDEMRKWYFDLASFEAKKGFKFSFIGEGREGTKYVHLCEVTEVIPGRKLSYSWQYEGLNGYSEVSFELVPENKNTKVIISHKGLPSFAANGPDFAIGSFEGGWDHILNTSLKNYLEKNKQE